MRTLNHVQSLYESINRVHGATEWASLQIIKIESGSSIRIDLKGLGEPIKQVKNLIVEIWTKHRHRRVDEVIDHNRAVASSIHLLEEIDKKVKKDSLSNEDGSRLKRAIVTNTLGLFKDGALISEIPQVETVDNVKLLDAFGPKLLAAPEDLNGFPGPYPNVTSTDPLASKDEPKKPTKKRRA